MQPDYVGCLECGPRGQALRRHLRVQRGLDVAQYRARWKLSLDHAVTAPTYSARRSAMAKVDRARPPAGPGRGIADQRRVRSVRDIRRLDPATDYRL
jgi:predicted transcriptional regulator